MRLTLSTLTIAMCLALSACGGGSDSSNEDLGQLPGTNSGSIVQVEDTLNINQGVELALYYPNDTLSNIHWQQTAGQPINLVAQNTKVLAFTPETAGDYSFSVSFSVNGGALQTLEQDITVNEQDNGITARLGHAVLSENKVSLRASLNNITPIGNTTWQQLSGPKIDFSDHSDDWSVVYFDAPKVSTDTLITFEVSSTDTNNTYTDSVTILVEKADAISSSALFDERVARVSPYNNNSPYANDIVHCVYANTLIDPCTLNTLPLIAEETKGSSESPSVEDIMNRVVVSHQWMGDRFKHFIENYDEHNDFKNLLRATTAIVISYDVRPSFYWAATGAIYLDAENFWLNPQERDTINEAPDYRSDFGKDLNFVMPWRYVKDNDYASRSFSRNIRTTRTEEDGLYRLTSLMYHELAHANDFFPSTQWYSHSGSTSIYNAAVGSDTESDKLTDAYPLNSNEMNSLAKVSFRGETATSTQVNYQPSDVEGFFSTDSANDYYNYSSTREDYAMLFEELMMKSRYGVVRDVAITNKPSGDNVTALDYIVTWGQRGRIGEEDIKPRVNFAAKRILPEFDSDSAIATLAAPIPMISGDNWLDNLNISPSNANINNASPQFSAFIKAPITVPDMRSDVTRYYHKALPKK
ncbi:hypothetical protein [Litorilituus sediminis]|uniref:Lipoprotein n=1 Tax=Litorilituus sediminis TaxID=718192 RepID=A0A4V0ZFS4_9GAMM|nr:hypothetical protein [Litorilituus sediminis]QBG34810.1 hypothetical protein EMK97_03170 [Litorilituus sediminis]